MNSCIEVQLVKAAVFGHTGGMTKWLAFLAILILSSAVGQPVKLDTLKIGTTTYSNVVVLGANATDLYFSHSHGFANVKLKYIAPDLQKRFQYDPKAAEEAERRQAENEILYQTTLARTSTAQPGNSPATRKASVGTETGLADPLSDKSLLGKPWPALQVDKWLGDKPSLDGKFVLINFWASWSAPCRQYIPELNSLQKKYADKLAVVGITAESERDVADAEPRIEYASGLDSKAKLTAAAGVTSIPCVLLMDPKGTVLYVGHPAALTEKKLQEIFSRASAE